MDTQELGKKVKQLFTKGAEASKEAFEKAGDKVQDFTDKSVTKIEKKQLENKLEAKYAELGKQISSILNDKDKIVINDEEIASNAKKIQKEIKDFLDQIKEKDSLLK